MPVSRPVRRTSWYQLLQVRLALLGLLAVLAAVGVTGWSLLQRAERDTLVARERLEILEAQRAAGLIEGRVRSQMASLAVVGRDIPGALVGDAVGLEALLRARPLLLSQFDNVFVADLSGRVQAMHDDKGFQHAAVSLADRAYFRAAVAGARDVVSEAVFGRYNHQPVVVIAHPLLQGGRVIGVLGGSVRLRSHALLAGLEGTAAQAGSALVVMTDAGGNLIAHPDAALVGMPLAAESQLAGPLARWVAAGRPMGQAGLDVSDANNLVAVAGLPTANWLLWRLQPRAQVLAPLDAARRHALLTGGAVATALALLMLAMLWRLLQPLRQLKARAERLFDADLDADAGWPDTTGEVGQLAAVLRRVGAERRGLEKENARVLRQLQSVMSAAPMGILFTRERRLELVSPQACRLLGRPESELLGRLAQIIYASHEDYARIGPLVGQAFQKHEPFVAELQFLRAGAHPFWGQLSGRPVDWGDASAGTIWILNDISEQVLTRNQLEWAALHDTLTGLANRQALQQRLNHIMAMPQQAQPAALLVMDLDRFKPINDQHGHAAGDAALRAVSQAIAGRIRSTDLLARMGGDEFAVILERCPADVAARVAEEIRHTVAALAVDWQGTTLTVGISIGVAALADEFTNAAAWLAAADEACYDAKASGRNAVCHAGVAAAAPIQPPTPRWLASPDAVAA